MHRLLTALIVLFSFNTIPSAIRQYRVFMDAYGHQQAGDHATAGKIYSTMLSDYPDSFLRREAMFNLACAEFAQNRPLSSATLYAGLQTVKGAIGVNASYNRGNALAMIAFANPKAPGYREKLGASLGSYRQALLADPGNTDARINYEIVLRALQRLSLPPTPSGGGGGGSGAPDRPTRQQGVSEDVTNLVLDNARLEEGQMIRKYFRPAPPRQTPKEQQDW
ncbi:MAG: hypothetical protein HGB29_07385 [Chlorobiaceae bacterium]|nr:hypothetical protein [Chlorobiaceae bacterium]NTW74669.1 hypothetical protein [Chlorobiaceae bacterium]